MMDQDFENEYFQNYAIFSNQENQIFNIEHEGQSQNFFPISMREPLSLELSNNDYLPDCKEVLNLQPTRAITATNEVPSHESHYYVTLTHSKVVFEELAHLKYKAAFQGTKDDTVELNINFKTMLVNFFKELTLANQLSVAEIQHINKFSNRAPSFHSLKEFFEPFPENENIRNLCLHLFSSSECVRKVMGGRSKLKTKIQMVKYIEKMRLNILNSREIIKWKDVIKKDDL